MTLRAGLASELGGLPASALGPGGGMGIGGAGFTEAVGADLRSGGDTG